MDWLYYLLEANLYLLLFYGFYKLFLQHETFYHSNRYFLLFSSSTSFILPILQLGFLRPTSVTDTSEFAMPAPYAATEMAKIARTPMSVDFDYATLIYPIYLFIAVCFALKLSISLIKIITLWLKAKKTTMGKITFIEIHEQTTAFSFFNLLFIHPHLAEKETVLNHEMVHIKQKHSADILFFELLQITCWFNPIIYFIKKDIKLLHEYIADELSTINGLQKHEYAMFLIQNSFGIVPTPLTNQIFNQSILKRRINMLNKKRTAGWARLRLLLSVPLAIGMLCLSTLAFTKDYGYVDLLPERAVLQQLEKAVNDEVQMAKVGRYAPNYVFDENYKYKSLEKRLIIVNGSIIEDNNRYYGNSNADKVLFLKPKEAAEKYGLRGKYGAVEVYGRETILQFQAPYLIADTAKFPAASPQKDPVKFPPPVIKKNLKAPPPVAAPPANQNLKNGLVKFPPPIVKPDKRNLKAPPPVEVPPANYKTKEDQVKFPPPVVNLADQDHFYPKNRYKHDGKQYVALVADPRYIVINGEPIKENGKFHGVTNTQKITFLSSPAAIKAYGKEKGKNGAIVISGTDLKYVQMAPGPPPAYINIALLRNDNFYFKVPNTENEGKTLTVYNNKNEIVFNDSDYRDNWNGQLGNYKNYNNGKISAGKYSFLMKLHNDPKGNKRGFINIK